MRALYIAVLIITPFTLFTPQTQNQTLTLRSLQQLWDPLYSRHQTLKFLEYSSYLSCFLLHMLYLVTRIDITNHHCPFPVPTIRYIRIYCVDVVQISNLQIMLHEPFGYEEDVGDIIRIKQ